MYQFSMYLWTWHCLTQCPPFSPPSIIQYFPPVSLCQAFCIQNGSVLSVFVWLFVQGCGRESSARRAQISVPSWGRNTPKWWWCTEQVKKKKNSACRGLYSCQQINAVKSNLSYKMGWTSVRSNLLPSYLSQCTFMIYLTRFSYFMYRLKTTTRQSEFLLWQQ